MRTYLFAPLLFVLSAAAPVADDHIDFPVLQKRDVLCEGRFGHGILEKDCEDAVRVLRRMAPNTMHPGTGLPIPNIGSFSRFNPDGHYRLPQRFSVGTCTIIVDSIEPVLSLPSTWNLVADYTKVVIDRCVHSHGIGGRCKMYNINSVIANEANLGAEIREPWQRCVTLINMQQQGDSFMQCLLNSIERNPSEAERAESRTSRTQPRQARNIEDISVL